MSDWIGDSGDTSTPSSGNWGNPADWSPAGVPGAGDYADFSGSDSYIVTYDTTDTVYDVDDGDTLATLLLTGGTLSTEYFTWYGQFSQTGGTLDIAGTPEFQGPATLSGGDLIVEQNGYFFGTLDQTGGTLDIQTGALNASGSLVSLGGTVTGAGTLVLGGTHATLQAGAVLDINTVTLGSGAVLTLAAGAATHNYTYEGDFIAGYGSTLSGNGQNFILGPASGGTFAGTFAGGGSLEIQGLVDVGGLALTGAGTELLVSGTALQDSNSVTLGAAATDTDTLSIATGGTYDIVSQSGISGNSLSSIVIAAGGALEATSPPGGESIEAASLSQTGLIVADSTLMLQGIGPSSLGQASLNGGIAGTGELEIGAYEVATLGGSALDVASLAIGNYYETSGELLLSANQSFGGTLDLGEGTIDTNGHVFSLGTASAGALANIVDGGGTMKIAGTVALSAPTLTGSGTELLITGEVYEQYNYFRLGTVSGDSTTLSIASAGTYDMPTEFGIFGVGTAALDNAGLLEVTGDQPFNGPLLSAVDFTNTGDIAVNIGTLTLASGTASIGGTVEGTGMLEVYGSQTTTLAAGAALDIADLALYGGTLDLAANQYYGGTFSGSGGTINLDGHTLALTHGTLANTVDGGTLIAAGVLDTGAVYLTGAGTELLDVGTIFDDGQLALGNFSGDATTLSIANGALFDIQNGGEIGSGYSNSSVIDNAGLFEVNGSEIESSIFTASFVNTGTLADLVGGLSFNSLLDNGGVLFVNDGLVSVNDELIISGPVTADAGKAGTFVINNGAELAFTGGGDYTNTLQNGSISASQTVSFTDNTGTLVINDPTAFAGTIMGFSGDDDITIGGLEVTEYSYANGILTLNDEVESGGSLTIIAAATLALPGIDPADLSISEGTGIYGGSDVHIDAATAAPFPIVNTDSPSTWIGPDGGSWSDGNNWSTLVDTSPSSTLQPLEPGSANQVTLSGTGTPYTVGYNTTDTVDALVAAAGTTLAISGGHLTDSYQLGVAAVSIAAGTLEMVDAGVDDLGQPVNLIATLSLGGAGVLRVDDGLLGINGGDSSFYFSNSTIDGTLAGAGGIAINTGTVTIGAAADLAIATLSNSADMILQGDQSYAGSFASAQTLDTNGHDFDLTGNSTIGPNAMIIGGGTVTVGGTGTLGGNVSGTGTELLITDTALTDGMSVGGSLSGQVGEFVIAASGTLDLLGQGTDIGGQIAGTMINNGFLEKTIAGLGYIDLNQFTNTGTIEIDRGTLALFEGTASLNGLFDGGGALELDGEITTFAATVTLDVATLSLSSGTITFDHSETYNGVLSSEYAALDLNGTTLTLGFVGNPEEGVPPSSGLLVGGGVNGGELDVRGDYYLSGFSIAGSGAELLDEGDITAANAPQFGLSSTDSTTLDITSFGTYDIVSNAGNAFTGLATVLNAGLLEMTAPLFNGVQADYFTNTGTIDVVTGGLGVDAYFGTIAGLVTGAGTLELESFGSVTLEAAADLAVKNLELQGFGGTFALGGNVAYEGNFNDNGTLNTNGFGLALGTASSGTLGQEIIGGGTVTIGGAVVVENLIIGGSGTALDITGTAELNSEIYTAYASPTIAEGTIDIGITGTFDLDTDSGLSGFASIDNAGLIEKTAVGGSSTLDVTSVLNSGTIAADFGTIDITGGLINNGVVEETGLGAVIVGGGISGTGVFIVDPAAITFDGPVAAGQIVSLTGPDGTLTLGDAPQFDGVIRGFGTGDLIVVESFVATSESFVNGTLDLSDGTSTILLDIDGDFHTGDFNLVTTASETEIVICYLRGTRIMTPAGEVAIETLQIGDPVIARFGGVQPIKWIGRQSYGRQFLEKNRAQMPVHIAAGALDGALPNRDLYVSPGHSMLLGQTLVLARNLINGVTIRQDTAPEEIHYYQLEFDAHDCVLAEGAWSESYADAWGLRAAFHNAAEFRVLYPDYPSPEEPLLCAPRPQNGPAMDAALRPVVTLATLTARHGPLRGWIDHINADVVQGWAQDLANPELPVLLQILVGDRHVATILACDPRADLAAAGIGRGYCSFACRLQQPLTAQEMTKIRVMRAIDGTNLALAHDAASTLVDGVNKDAA